MPLAGGLSEELFLRVTASGVLETPTQFGNGRPCRCAVTGDAGGFDTGGDFTESGRTDQSAAPFEGMGL